MGQTGMSKKPTDEGYNLVRDGRPEMDPEEERDMLRACFDALCDQAFEGGDIDGGDFQNILESMGVLVLVPATRQFREDWDAEEMFIQRWKEQEVRAVLELEAMAQPDGDPGDDD